MSCADSKEFFLRKGSGWALREFGKYAPLEVSTFVHNHEALLSNLTVREALKNL
ncbi:MAG: DNA alkylation repair protein [Saprospiraceae bacterium]|nr:DNA alkylation repair protein [Saprospiraceae bacterium]